MKIIKKLGFGAFSNVFLAEINGGLVAVKLPNEAHSKEKTKKYTNYEAKLLSLFINSEYLINMKDYKISDDETYIAIELLGDELYTLIRHYQKNNAMIPLSVTKNISKQILHGLDELSNVDIFHNDMKSENILFVKPLEPIFKQSFTKFKHKLKQILITHRDDYVTYCISYHINNYYFVLQELLLIKAKVKISDFGNAFSRVLAKSDPNTFKYTHPTRHYISPEILIGGPVWKETDMWSFGCILYELLTGDIMFNPYRDNNMGVNCMHLGMMIKVFGEFPSELLASGHYTSRYFVGTKYKFQYLMTNINLHRLLAYFDLPNDELSNIVEFLGPIFELDPKKRITPHDCLKAKWLVNY